MRELCRALYIVNKMCVDGQRNVQGWNELMIMVSHGEVCYIDVLFDWNFGRPWNVMYGKLPQIITVVSCVALLFID